MTAEDAAKPLNVPETMDAFACNQKGCCCHGWAIAFTAEEAIDLVNLVPDKYQRPLLEGANATEVTIGGTPHVRLQLNPVGERKECFFLADDMSCMVHAQKGHSRLPHVCRAFPVTSYDVDELGVDVYYDATCPEVMNVLANDDGPYVTGTRDPASDPGLADRASQPLIPRDLQLGDIVLSPREAVALREVLVGAANARTTDPMRLLADFAFAIADVAVGQPFSLYYDANGSERDYAAFDTFFDQCVATHGGRPLYTMGLKFRRFVHEESFPDDWSGLEAHTAVRDDWRDRIDPLRPELQPLLYRFEAHRFFSLYASGRTMDKVAIAYGNLVFTIATAFRYADAFCRWLDRPLDKTMFKVALGAAEHFYRTLDIPPNAMIWFGVRPSHDHVDAPDPDAA